MTGRAVQGDSTVLQICFGRLGGTCPKPSLSEGKVFLGNI
jgi:hypothetical protein